MFGGTLALGATASHLERFWHGPWQLGIVARHIGSDGDLQPIDNAPRKVAWWTVFDLTFAWRGPRDRVSPTLFNAVDREPPFRSIGVGCDEQVHDPVGRVVSLTWRHSFEHRCPDRPAYRRLQEGG